MARPIAETPILKGKDAVAFIKRMKAQKDKCLSKSERARIKANFEKLNAIAEF